MSDSAEFEQEDAEHSLYGGGFLSSADKAQMEILHQCTPEQLASHQFHFEDERLSILLFRYRARNFPYTLTSDEQLKWQQHCQNALQYGGKGRLSAEEYMLKLENLAHEHEDNSRNMSIIKALYHYIHQ